MLRAPTAIEHALERAQELRLALDGGALFTELAEKMCGQEVTADIERVNPPSLWAHEADQMDVPYDSNWVALRRTGWLVQADAARVARVTSVVLLSRITLDEARLLQTTSTPLGKVLGPDARGRVLETSMEITEFAVHCRRLILRDDGATALTTEQVLWSWLCQVDSPDI